MDIWQIVLAIFGLFALALVVWRAMVKPLFAVKLFVPTMVITQTLTGSLDARDWASRLTWSEVAGGLLILSWLASRFRKQQSAKYKQPDFFVAWLLFLAMAAVSMIWFKGGVYGLGVSELLAVLYLTLVYYALTALIVTDDDLRGVLGVWVVTAAVLFLIGSCDIVSLLARHRHWFPLEDPLDPYRIRLTFRNGAQLGAYTLVTFFMILAYATFPGVSRVKRVLCRWLAVIACPILFFSSKRSAWVGLGVGLCVLLWYIARSHGLPKKFMLVPALGILLVAGVIRESKGLEGWAAWRVEILDPQVMEQNEFLQENWGGAVDAFSKHWVAGIGYGGFEQSQYDPGGYEIHSTPLRMLAELGLVGFLLFFFAEFLMFRTAYVIASPRSRTPWGLPGACLFSGLVAVFVSSIYHIHFRNREYWLMLAVLTALSRLHGSTVGMKTQPAMDQVSGAAPWVAADAFRLQPSADARLVLCHPNAED